MGAERAGLQTGHPSLAGTLSHLTSLGFLQKLGPDESPCWAFPGKEGEVLKSMQRQRQRRRRVRVFPGLFLAL